MYKVKLGLLIAIVSFSHTLVAKESVVVSEGDIRVTDQEVRAYIAERVAMGQPAESFGKTQTLASAAENVLVIKKLAEEARSNGTSLTPLNEVEIEIYRQKILYREYINSLIAKELENTDWQKAAKEEYLANPGQFTRGREFVELAHILIHTEGRTEEEAESLALRVLDEAHNGKDFFELAKSFTDEPGGKEREGKLGRVTRGKMVPEFEQASFALTLEQPLSGLVKTEFGYHIIKLLDRGEPRKLTFEEVESELITELKRKAPGLLRRQMAAKAKGAGNAEVNESVLLKLVDEYQTK